MLMDAWRGCERCCRGGRGYPCYADTSPSWAVPCLGEGERLGGDACLSPLTPAQPIGMRALGRRPRVPGRGPAPACGPSGSALMGKPVIQRALPGMGGKRDSFSRGKCLTTSSPPGWSGAPISQANQPGKGLILGLCQVISSLVHLCSL